VSDSNAAVPEARIDLSATGASDLTLANRITDLINQTGLEAATFVFSNSLNQMTSVLSTITAGSSFKTVINLIKKYDPKVPKSLPEKSIVVAIGDSLALMSELKTGAENIVSSCRLLEDAAKASAALALELKTSRPLLTANQYSAAQNSIVFRDSGMFEASVQSSLAIKGLYHVSNTLIGIESLIKMLAPTINDAAFSKFCSIVTSIVRVYYSTIKTFVTVWNDTIHVQFLTDVPDARAQLVLHDKQNLNAVTQVINFPVVDMVTHVEATLKEFRRVTDQKTPNWVSYGMLPSLAVDGSPVQLINSVLNNYSAVESFTTIQKW